jgi:hypothetical protein
VIAKMIFELAEARCQFPLIGYHWSFRENANHI